MTKFSLEEIEKLHPYDLAERVSELHEDEQVISFMMLPGKIKGNTFSYLSWDLKEKILSSLGTNEIAGILETMTPDDRTAVFEDFPDTIVKDAVNFLSPDERKIAMQLIGYEEESVGRIMTPHYVQVHPDWTIKKTLQHIKKNGQKAETLNYIYVVDENQKLINDIRIGLVLMANSDDFIRDLMGPTFTALTTTQSSEDAVEIFQKYDRSALPVVTESGMLVGIVTSDDIIDELEKRDTEDIQKFGGMDSLDMPYMNVDFFTLIKKRAGWLVVLFLGEMLTASAMSYYDEEIGKAVVLALFVPLVISSGGNSGSQAATLIIRALAIQEIKLKDWWYVMRREIFSGFTLGCILAIVGITRILLWQKAGLYDYGEYSFWIAMTIGVSLIFIVLWGTLTGSMIPLILKKLKLDPATSSAPFVATLVDVTGLIIYFSVAAMLLTGKLL